VLGELVEDPELIEPPDEPVVPDDPLPMLLPDDELPPIEVPPPVDPPAPPLPPPACANTGAAAIKTVPIVYNKNLFIRLLLRWGHGDPLSERGRRALGCRESTAELRRDFLSPSGARAIRANSAVEPATSRSRGFRAANFARASGAS
jgi:hypothetical protein